MSAAAFHFEITHTARTRHGVARAAVFHTPHGVLETPAFMPVGTHASVRGLSSDEVFAAGGRLMLSNAYHLYLRPGDTVVRALGGLHAFARWCGPMLTDSGGYQVYSLAKFREVHESGVTFKSTLDGSMHAYTPERVMQIERNLGADVIMQLDELIAGGAEYGDTERAMERSVRWLARCRTEFERLERDGRAPLPDALAAAVGDDVLAAPPQALFPIVQGGTFAELRVRSARAILDAGAWHGIAVGGLSVGEAREARDAMIDVCAAELPEALPRYLMGVGFPDDLLELTARGMDMFDCVAATRMGRHGTAFTPDGTVQVRHSSFRLDRTPLVDGCACPACTEYERAHLRHLFVSEQPLGPRLLALHNLTFLHALMADARARIADGSFASWSEAWLARYRARPRGRSR